MLSLPNRLGWLIAAALGLFVIASITGVVSGGPLDPSAPPASTRPLVEPRLPISQPAPGGFPITISESGSYYLTDNITGESGQSGIVISASDVTLDLNGFTLAGVPGALTGIGTNSVRNITVSGGILRGWPSSAIVTSDATHIRIREVTVQGNSVGTPSPAIVLGGDAGLFDCLVSDNGARGITMLGSAVVERCQITRNGAEGIVVAGSAGRVADNTIADNGLAFSSSGIWIQGGAIRVVVEHNTIIDNSGTGIFLEGFESIVLRNIARGNGMDPTDNYFISGPCTGCDIAPIESAAAATSPVANISD